MGYKFTMLTDKPLRVRVQNTRITGGVFGPEREIVQESGATEWQLWDKTGQWHNIETGAIPPLDLKFKLDEFKWANEFLMRDKKVWDGSR